jgi:glutaminyl-peptide cyclotransferase
MRLLALLALLTLGASQPTVPVQQVEIVRTFPHDRAAFTQGLLYRDGRLYESTGLEGRSSVREVRLEDGRVLKQASVPPPFFGEGLVDWGNRLISLTWQHGRGFIWDRATLKPLGEWRYPGEGWALTHNGRELIMSDGTPQLRFLDPATLKEKRRITVTVNGQRLGRLNELEWVKGEVLANIWMTDRIARIDPATGRVRGWIDLGSLVRRVPGRGYDDVANGIAYDAKADRLFVTGKHWPVLFQVRVR